MERGSRVMTGVHKRCYYAMRLEFKILARLCGEYLPPEYPYDVYGANRMIKQGAVKIDGVKCEDNKQQLTAGEYVVQVGKRKFARITVA